MGTRYNRGDKVLYKHPTDQYKETYTVKEVRNPDSSSPDYIVEREHPDGGTKVDTAKASDLKKTAEPTYRGSRDIRKVEKVTGGYRPQTWSNMGKSKYYHVYRVNVGGNTMYVKANISKEGEYRDNDQVRRVQGEPDIETAENHSSDVRYDALPKSVKEEVADRIDLQLQN